jgi:hypothetical protein
MSRNPRRLLVEFISDFLIHYPLILDLIIIVYLMKNIQGR